MRTLLALAAVVFLGRCIERGIESGIVAATHLP